MGWLKSNNLLELVTKAYLAGRIGPVQTVFRSLSLRETGSIESGEEALVIIASCETFAALCGFPSQELNFSEIGPRQRLYERTLWNVDLLAVQALALLGGSQFLKPEWLSNYVDLKSRLEQVSARYEDHRQNPNRGVKIYDEATGEWIDAEQKCKA